MSAKVARARKAATSLRAAFAQPPSLGGRPGTPKAPPGVAGLADVCYALAEVLRALGETVAEVAQGPHTAKGP